MSIESRVDRMLQLKDRLPVTRRQIFEYLYQRGMGEAAAARELGLTDEQFRSEHSAMLTSLRRATVSA